MESSVQSKYLAVVILPAYSRHTSHGASKTHTSPQPTPGDIRTGREARREMQLALSWGHLTPIHGPSTRTTHLPSPLPSFWPTLPWSLQLSEVTILKKTFLFLMYFRIFLPTEYLVCGLFCPRHIHLHFSIMIRVLLCLSHFPNSFRLFLCLCWCLPHFSIQNHLWISFPSPFSLPKVVNKDRVRWEERPAAQPTREPTLPRPPSILKAVYFHAAHFSIHMTGCAAKMICLHLSHVSGPFINCWASEFTDGTSVPVSFYALVTHKRKGFAFISRATWEIVVTLIGAIWKQNPPSPYPVGNYIPFYTPKLFRGLPSLLSLCRTSNLPFQRVSREPKPFSPSKIIWKLVCTEPLNSHFMQIEFCWLRHGFANWQSLIPCRSWKAGKGLRSGCSRKRCKLDFKMIFEHRRDHRESYLPELASDAP